MKLKSRTICYLSLFAQVALYPLPALSQDPTGVQSNDIPLREYPADLLKKRMAMPSSPMGPTKKGKVINGKKALKGMFPWQTAILLSIAPQADPFSGVYCGGTLLDWSKVLTAAHCTYEKKPTLIAMQPEEIDVYVGSTNFTDGHRVKVKAIHRHKDYNPRTEDNDIAVLDLINDVPKDGLALIQIIGDNDSDEIAPGGPAIAVGWGSIVEGELDPSLREAVKDLQYIDRIEFTKRENCDLDHYELKRSHWRKRLLEKYTEPVVTQILDAWYPKDKPVVNDNMICAGSAVGSQDTCFGDSGGPLLVQRQSKYIQVGIVSWGAINKCATAESQGVYTRLSKFKEWIGRVSK